MSPHAQCCGAAHRDKSDCHFKKTATEYDRETGIKWLSGTAKGQSDITLTAQQTGGKHPEAGRALGRHRPRRRRHVGPRRRA
jgi:hypothetical protein